MDEIKNISNVSLTLADEDLKVIDTYRNHSLIALEGVLRLDGQSIIEFHNKSYLWYLAIRSPLKIVDEEYLKEIEKLVEEHDGLYLKNFKGVDHSKLRKNFIKLAELLVYVPYILGVGIPVRRKK